MFGNKTIEIKRLRSDLRTERMLTDRLAKQLKDEITKNAILKARLDAH